MRNNVGIDFQSAQLGSTAPGPNGANWIGLTANATAPAMTNTTLIGEITTPGGGLLRAQATYAHTAGVASYTLSKTFTANVNDALPVTVNKVGVFVGAGPVAMPFEDTIVAAPINAVGDTVTVTQTVSL